MPLERRRSRGGVSSRAAAAVLIATSAPLELPAGALSLLYDLTAPAEVRVFERVVEELEHRRRQGPGRIAEHGQDHMNRMFAKLGVRTRMELIKLAHSIEAAMIVAPVEP